MKLKTFVSAIAILSMTQGCSIVRRELRHSGGFAGDILDRRMFEARSSKQLQLLRFAMVIALASRVGLASVRDADDVKAFVAFLGSASEELNFLAGHLYGPGTCPDLNPSTPTPAPTGAAETNVAAGQPAPATPPANANTAAPRTCDTYAALFESDIPQLEYKIVRLVLLALPHRQAAQFLRSARSGNILGAAWHFLKLAAAAADGFHRGAAVYRSSQEILAAVIHTTSGAHCAQPFARQNIRTVEDAADCLGLSQESLFDNPREATILFPTEITEAPFQALFEIIRTSCGLLPNEVPLGTTNPGAANARLVQCSRLTFEPSLRFGGRSRWTQIREEADRAEAGAPTNAQNPAPEPVTTTPETPEADVAKPVP